MVVGAEPQPPHIRIHFSARVIFSKLLVDGIESPFPDVKCICFRSIQVCRVLSMSGAGSTSKGSPWTGRARAVA